VIAKLFRGYMPVFPRQAFPARSEAAPQKLINCEAEALPQAGRDKARAVVSVVWGLGAADAAVTTSFL
jgi:hypothetical protein